MAALLSFQLLKNREQIMSRRPFLEYFFSSVHLHMPASLGSFKLGLSEVSGCSMAITIFSCISQGFV